MMTKESVDAQLVQLYQRAFNIYNSSLDWEEKFTQIFSKEISSAVCSLTSLDYYDPDTTYEEDTKAFMDAFTKEMHQRGLLTSTGRHISFRGKQIHFEDTNPYVEELNQAINEWEQRLVEANKAYEKVKDARVRADKCSCYNSGLGFCTKSYNHEGSHTFESENS
jgi:hypothetical protein